jgi:hypothetical protein
MPIGGHGGKIRRPLRSDGRSGEVADTTTVMEKNVVRLAFTLFVLGSACSPAPERDGTMGEGGAGDDTGGSGGRAAAGGAGGGSTASGGSAGASAGGTSGSPGAGGGPGAGGASGSGGAGGSGSGGATQVDAGAVAPGADAAPKSDAAGGGGPPVGPPASGQGPVAEGKIAFSQDFEQNMDGMSRSPANLPEDRIQIIDDPVNQRGKIVRIMFKEGDNFRTSAGTQPRSWFSAAKGYTVKPGTTVSVAWGFMWDNVNMNAHFAQLIRDGGPTWMWDVDGSGFVSMTHHRGTGATGNIMKLEPMKWYDFMVTTHYTNGGETKFWVNGKLVLTGKSPGGPDGRFDFGIYTRAGAHPARTVYISNVSIGEL